METKYFHYADTEPIKFNAFLIVLFLYLIFIAFQPVELLQTSGDNSSPWQYSFDLETVKDGTELDGGSVHAIVVELR